MDWVPVGLHWFWPVTGRTGVAWHAVWCDPEVKAKVMEPNYLHSALSAVTHLLDGRKQVSSQSLGFLILIWRWYLTLEVCMRINK